MFCFALDYRNIKIILTKVARGGRTLSVAFDILIISATCVIHGCVFLQYVLLVYMFLLLLPLPRKLYVHLSL